MSDKPVSPAQIIFNRRFMCQLQHMHTLSKSDINIFGISSSGDRNIDEGLLKSWVYVQLTIAEMVEHNSRGVPIIIDNPSDSVIIYETLNRHLENWRYHVKNSINTGKVPLDDLRKMDEFAAKIYPMAASHKPPEQLKLSKGIQDILNKGQKRFKVSTAEEVSALQIKKEIKTPHKPVAAEIAREFGNKNNLR